MRFIVTDTELDIEIAEFNSAGEAHTFLSTLGQDGSLKVSKR